MKRFLVSIFILSVALCWAGGPTIPPSVDSVPGAMKTDGSNAESTFKANTNSASIPVVEVITLTAGEDVASFTTLIIKSASAFHLYVNGLIQPTHTVLGSSSTRLPGSFTADATITGIAYDN
jgi:hypothetical protein